MPDKKIFSTYIVESPGKHVRRSSRRRPACSIPSKDVYNCTELMEHISSKCEWNTLVRMGNCTRFLRRLVQDIIRRRMSVCLERFISGRYHARLFELLETTGAAIVGGFVRHLMCLEDDIYHRVYPSQLSIVIPVGRTSYSNIGRKWVHFISNCGDHEGSWQEATPAPYSSRSSRTVYFDRSSNKTQISVIECNDDNVISTLLCAPETSLFNVLTSRRFYSFYPSLISRHISLETTTYQMASRHGDPIQPFHFGFTTYDSSSTSFLLQACEEGCYSLTRSLSKMEGISRFRWGGISGEYDQDVSNGTRSHNDCFEALDINWRIGSRCRNFECEFFRFGFIE